MSQFQNVPSLRAPIRLSTANLKTEIMGLRRQGLTAQHIAEKLSQKGFLTKTGRTINANYVGSFLWGAYKTGRKAPGRQAKQAQAEQKDISLTKLILDSKVFTAQEKVELVRKLVA